MRKTGRRNAHMCGMQQSDSRQCLSLSHLRRRPRSAIGVDLRAAAPTSQSARYDGAGERGRRLLPDVRRRPRSVCEGEGPPLAARRVLRAQRLPLLLRTCAQRYLSLTRPADLLSQAQVPAVAHYGGHLLSMRRGRNPASRPTKAIEGMCSTIVLAARARTPAPPRAWTARRRPELRAMPPAETPPAVRGATRVPA